MLKAKLLRSGSNPLWVAAFFFKNLKRPQILDTDISSSVDKILQDEMDVVSYRVLGYLLLGVVRIYSKKVEYVLDDCNEVLIKINKFVINREDLARVETLRMSVTIPNRLELDAFELDVLEDAGGGHTAHTAPPEDITLKAKEVVCITEGFGLFPQEKFEEFDVGENTCSFDHHIVENVRLSHLLNMMDIEALSQNSPVDLLESRDIFQSSIFSQKEPMNFDSVLIEGLEKESVSLSGQDQQIIEDRTVDDIVPCEDEIHEESSRISHRESMDIGMVSGREKEHVLSVEAFNESHQVDNDQSSAKETSSSLCKMNQEIIGVHEARSFQESIEKPQEENSYENECVHHGNSSVAKEIHEKLIEESVEKHDNKGKSKFQEKVSLEDERLSVIPPKSKNLDVTPQSKFQGDSVGRPKRGATTPESILICTPAVSHGNSSVRKKIHEKHIEGSVEKHDHKGKSKFQEKVSVEDERLSVIPPKSKNLDVTPQSKFQGDSVGRPKRGATTPESILICTPAVSHGNSSVRKKIHEKHIEGSVEKHDHKGKSKFQEKVSVEDERLSVIPSKSKNLDVTPQSKFQGDSVGRPKQGATTPESMLISTPAVRERPHFSRKRKVVLDEMTVLPNKVLRKSIHDASDLVSNRRKSRCTLRTVQRESLISSLPNRFYEPLLPGCSSELQILSSKKKMKIPDSLQIVETSGNLDMSESQTVGSPEHIATAPLIPPQCPDVAESQASGSPEHIPTPPCQETKGRSIEHPARTEIQNLDNLECSCPHESIEIEQSLEMNEALNLMDEEINSSGTENSELSAGWSDRTRQVASYLRKQKEEDVVNFSQVFGGRARKESARLFYEVLVLKTTGYVDVQQNEAYGDIAISKLPKLDQTF
ncbi:Sister chromatid cohesion 1 protein 2 [Spatholobus suberectus]|nr:Sister chromatid cohesion 1 protein 2 [Spatholobus suberectus]